ncbi:MAG: transposase [Candidatus Kaiserbacteria bacterium]|nr:transposase [Candidatus Kaiserbacteria bacterium]
MTNRRVPFAVNEWYHCYNRGIEKRIVFEDTRDYHRFLELLYLANDEFPLRRSDISIHKFEEILKIPRGKKLVAIGAFCLMPNHFHLVLKEVSEGGVTAFMRKIGTAYTLYFNARHRRNGNLFLKPFRSIHVFTDRYFQHLINYIHCNSATLYEPEWMASHVVDPQFLGEQIAAYPYSSLSAHAGIRTPISAILDAEIFSITRPARIQKMLQEARQYAQNNVV